MGGGGYRREHPHQHQGLVLWLMGKCRICSITQRSWREMPEGSTVAGRSRRHQVEARSKLEHNPVLSSLKRDDSRGAALSFSARAETRIEKATRTMRS